MLACKTEAGFSKEYESQAIIENMSNPIMAEFTKICYNSTCVHVHGCHELTNELTNYDVETATRNIGCAWSHCNSDIKTFLSYIRLHCSLFADMEGRSGVGLQIAP